MSSGMLYWILMLDNVRGFLTASTIALGVAATICIVICIILLGANSEYGVSDKDKKENDDYRIKSWNLFKKFVAFMIASALLLVFVPSSKQMAVIVVLPKIVNDERIQQEAKEIYELAKQGLKDLVIDKNALVPQTPEKKD